MKTPAHVDGMVAQGFEDVRAEFERNFTERGEIGAAVAAYWHGEKVVASEEARRFGRLPQKLAAHLEIRSTLPLFTQCR